MSDWKFHCDVLSVPESASAQEIKAAFRKLALKHHPDRNGGTSQSKERFQRLNVSYRYLMRNLASRPKPSEKTQTSMGSAHPPPPPHPSSRRETFRESPRRVAPLPLTKAQRWEKRFAAFLAAKPPSIPWAKLKQLWRRHKDTFLQVFPAATAAMAAMISVFVFLAHNLPERDPSRDPASVARDDRGRPTARCELLSFKNGNLVEKWKGELSEWDCDLRCMSWFTAHDGEDDSCSWKSYEFRQHKAPRPPAATADKPADKDKTEQYAVTPRPGLRADGFYDDPGSQAQPEFVTGETPDLDGAVPVVVRNVKLGDIDVLDFNLTPKVWLGDLKLIHGDPGVNRRQIRITPIRRGEVEVVITDHINQPIRKIIYNIR